jgi:hypothetical protein
MIRKVRGATRGLGAKETKSKILAPFDLLFSMIPLLLFLLTCLQNKMMWDKKNINNMFKNLMGKFHGKFFPPPLVPLPPS